MNPLIERELELLGETLAAKNADYGDAAFRPPPLVDLTPADALLVRIGDKMRRLQKLAKEPANVATETFDDTILDLAGYCLLYRAVKGTLTN
ncbi:MAG: DUF1599 domain-containing protein [Thermoguttaceae bacterium]|nr:DUF1599 domain-containing protein [Thermoguttaceae bacterium]